MKKNHEEASLHSIISGVKSGEIDVDAALEQLNSYRGFSDLGFAKIDHDRERRCGFPEFIFGEGKTPEHLQLIVEELHKNGASVVATRVSQDAADQVKLTTPEVHYDPLARVLTLLDQDPVSEDAPLVLIVTAGTTDLPVALEAKYTLEGCKCRVELLSDAGVAGIHRLLSNNDKLRGAAVIIAVAGMEGALPSVIGGLVSTPVIAVPTSVGYGASLKGMTAMFAMLNSCASGITVVNIDNGFGAACAANRIVKSISSDNI